MNIDLELFKKILASGAEHVISAQDELTDIDSRFGDADHGITMTKISKAILDEIRGYTGECPKELMGGIASAVMMVNGGSAGPLWYTLLDGMAENAPSCSDISSENLKEMLSGALSSLEGITTARVGDKTMMDALIPAVSAANACSGGYKEILQAAAEAARLGAEKSAEFVSKFGRAKSYKEKTIGTPDAGAVSMQHFFIGLYEAVRS